MKTFLEHVAQDIISKYGYNFSRIAIVFPNKRASLFLNEYIARMADQPIWSPKYITISELFRKQSNVIVGDQIKLICDLYKSFTKFVVSNETLDQFYGWGQVLLSDFDDIDKHLADPEQVFKNLTNIREFDDLSYLTDEQKVILKSFFSNFSDELSSELKKRFIMLWSNLYNIYKDFNEQIAKEGIAYEGALYKQVVNDDTNFDYDTYIFVGFNQVNEVEQKLFSKLKELDKAKFYWDFDSYYMDKDKSEAGFYIKQYLTSFPNELDNTDDDIYNNIEKDKNITYISAMTEDIQARYISDWLCKKERIKAGKKTAIVLCNENLLPTVIHCLPPEVENINITTGYPLSKLPISSLINLLISLQTAGRKRGTDKYRFHYVSAVLRHPYAKYISPNSLQLINELTTDKVYFPERKDLSRDEGLSLLFTDIESESDSDQNYQLSLWIIKILQLIGLNSKDEGDPLMVESIFHTYTLMQRLSNLMAAGDLPVDLTTFQRLITQITQTTSIPFHGEPAIGVQIMGVLETRNLDFEHVLILSCTEGDMPKGMSDTSFIPYSIRKAFGLTTIDNKVSIYSYYFHSLIQRASDVEMLYNTSTENGHTGEMSRFMLQLLVESGHNIERKSLRTGQTPVYQERKMITKNEGVMNVLNAKTEISPTSINRYLKCQLQFYYNVVAGLREPDETDDDQIDNRIFGNIFHKAAQLIYEQFIGRTITKANLSNILNDESYIERIVDRAFKEELFHINNERWIPEYNGTQIINRRVIIGYLRQLLNIDRKLAPINIKTLEQKVSLNLTFDTSNGERDINIGGIIDRLDSINTNGIEQIRVIDYKTGKKTRVPINSIEEIFDSNKINEKHKDYFLQTLLYSSIVRNSKEWNVKNAPVSPALIFIQHTNKEDYDPTLLINKQKIEDISTHSTEFIDRLKLLLGEIFEPTKPFLPTENIDNCNYCPYKRLCRA